MHILRPSKIPHVAVRGYLDGAILPCTSHSSASCASAYPGAELIWACLKMGDLMSKSMKTCNFDNFFEKLRFLDVFSRAIYFERAP